LQQIEYRFDSFRRKRNGTDLHADHLLAWLRFSGVEQVGRKRGRQSCSGRCADEFPALVERFHKSIASTSWSRMEGTFAMRKSPSRFAVIIFAAASNRIRLGLKPG